MNRYFTYVHTYINDITFLLVLYVALKFIAKIVNYVCLCKHKKCAVDIQEIQSFPDELIPDELNSVLPKLTVVLNGMCSEVQYST